MTTIATVALIAGLALTALMAGVYFAFSTAVMPGLARTDDRTYVTSMQRMNESILNPRFLSTFTGAFVVTAAAALLHLGDDLRARLPWIVAGGLLYGVTIVTTAVVNIPLNNSLVAAGDVTDVTDASAAEVRTDFHDRWTSYNTIRAVLCTVAVVVLAIAVSRPVG